MGSVSTFVRSARGTVVLLAVVTLLLAALLARGNRHMPEPSGGDDFAAQHQDDGQDPDHALLGSRAPARVRALLEQLRQAAGPQRDLLVLRETLDTSDPQLRAVVDAAQRHGIAEGVARLRADYWQRSARAAIPRRQLAPDKAQRLAALAAECMAHGWQFSQFPTYRIASPVAWKDDPFHDRSWRFWFHCFIFLEPGLEAHRAEQAHPFLEFARAIALDWGRFHVAQGNDHEFAWYDMAVGLRARMLAPIVDAALRNPGVPDGEVLELLLARIHALYLADQDQIAWHSNHGIYQLAGLLHLVRSVPVLRDQAAMARFACDGLQRTFREHFTAEGIHREHSPQYHVFVLNLLAQLLDEGWLDDPEFAALCRQANRNTLWFINPCGSLTRLGDTDDVAAADEIAFSVDARLRYVLTQGAEGQPPDAAWTAFPQSGYAIFRSPWSDRPWDRHSYLCFAAAFHCRTHKHADDFTFEWYEGQQPLVIDSGRYKYQYDDPMRQYIESTRAHNTVEIDGADSSRRALDAFGSALAAAGEADGAYYAEAELQRRRPVAVKHRRVLVFRPGQWLAVVDQLDAPDLHHYTQWFHFAPELEFEAGQCAAYAKLPADGRVLSVVPASDAPPLALTAHRGQKEPRIQGWTSFHRGEVVPNTALGVHVEASTCTVATLLVLGQQPVAADSIVLQADSSGQSIHLHWSADGQTEGFTYRRADQQRVLERHYDPVVAP